MNSIKAEVINEVRYGWAEQLYSVREAIYIHIVWRDSDGDFGRDIII